MNNKREFTVEYNGSWVSVNTLKNSNHMVADGLRRKFRKIYNKLINENKPEGKSFPKFEVHIYYNSRLDTDNVSGKFFVDSLKDCGVIIDDNKKYFRCFCVRPNEELKFNTYLINIKEV